MNEDITRKETANALKILIDMSPGSHYLDSTYRFGMTVVSEIVKVPKMHDWLTEGVT